MKPSFASFSQSLTVRITSIALVALALTIPTCMVQSVVYERASRYQQVVEELNGQWGGEQIIAGPLLVIPYETRWSEDESYHDDQGVHRTRVRSLHEQKSLLVLPESLDAATVLHSEVRRRGIYEAPVYSADLTLTATFAAPDWSRVTTREATPQWDRAHLALSVSDARHLQQLGEITVPGAALKAMPATGVKALPSGLQLPLKDVQALFTGQAVTLPIKLAGSTSFAVAPIGERNELRVSSDWPHPSFTGLLPDERSSVAAGFNAHWSSTGLSRSVAQYSDADGAAGGLIDHLAVVRLIEPVSLYNVMDRATKHAILFIVLTFAAFLAFEIASAMRPHPVQYVLVGAGIALFYLLLLALAEHLAFALSYALAASALVALTTWYSGFMLRAWSRALGVGALQATLYATLYVILRQEDHALLTGSVLLLLALFAMMYVTRGLSRTDAGTPPPHAGGDVQSSQPG